MKVKVGPVSPCARRGNALEPAGACARHRTQLLAPAGRGRFLADAPGAVALALVLVLAR